MVSIGPFATNLPNLYLSAGSSVISGEPEMFFLNEKIENISGDPKNLQNNQKLQILIFYLILNGKI